jgi:hypothetical protein
MSPTLSENSRNKCLLPDNQILGSKCISANILRLNVRLSFANNLTQIDKPTSGDEKEVQAVRRKLWQKMDSVNTKYAYAQLLEMRSIAATIVAMRSQRI